jgi:hypothetical protein
MAYLNLAFFGPVLRPMLHNFSAHNKLERPTLTNTPTLVWSVRGAILPKWCNFNILTTLKSFIRQSSRGRQLEPQPQECAPGPNVIKLSESVIYEYSW